MNAVVLIGVGLVLLAVAAGLLWRASAGKTETEAKPSTPPKPTNVPEPTSVPQHLGVHDRAAQAWAVPEENPTEGSTEDPKEEQDLDSEVFQWLPTHSLSVRRSRKAWAAENGWQFDKEDAALVAEWGPYVVSDAMPGSGEMALAKDVLTGRINGYKVAVADIEAHTILGVELEPAPSVSLEIRTAGRQPHVLTAGQLPQAMTMPTTGGLPLTVCSDDALSAQLMMSDTVREPLTLLMAACTEIIVTPGWILGVAATRPHPSQLIEVLGEFVAVADATRVLPHPISPELEITGLDPTRAFGSDAFTVGRTPEAAPALTVVEGSFGQHARPEEQEPPAGQWAQPPQQIFERQADIRLPRRDRGLKAREFGRPQGEEEPIGTATGQLPAVGQDPTHSQARRRPGQVVREDQAGWQSTLFTPSTGAGRHRKPSRSRSEHPEDPVVEATVEATVDED